MKKLFLILGAITLMTLSAFASHTSKNIVETAASSGSFNTLAQALQAAGLAETLQGNGPFTVFAPTDEAFSRLPAGTLEVLLRPENKEQLRAILTYHVVPGKSTGEDVTKTTSLTTVNGQELRISVLKGVVRVNDARVNKTDILASNGIIHVIDRVLLPRTGDVTQIDKVNDMLAAFESKAITARNDAAVLQTQGRNPQLNWRTHSDRLHRMSEHINAMGRMLADLESMKTKATLVQEKAIDASRPYLEEMARHTEQAILWLNEDQKTAGRAEYKETLSNLWKASDNLYQTVDTIIDYHEARMRMTELTEEPVSR